MIFCYGNLSRLIQILVPGSGINAWKCGRGIAPEWWVETVRVFLRYVLDNLKIALMGLLVELWTLNRILGEISEGNEAHGCWKLEKRWPYGAEKARTNESVWKCLGSPKDALELPGLSLPLGHQLWWWGDLKEQLAPFVRELTMPLSQESAVTLPWSHSFFFFFPNLRIDCFLECSREMLCFQSFLVF